MEEVQFENFFYGPDAQRFLDDFPNVASGFDSPGEMMRFFLNDEGRLQGERYVAALGAVRKLPLQNCHSCRWYSGYNVLELRSPSIDSASRVQDRDVYRVLKGLKALLERAGVDQIEGVDEGILAEEEKAAKLHAAVQFALSFGKMIGGTIRFISEDVYSGACQLIYLCKIWNKHDTTNSTKAFVMCSILAGCSVSLMGPLVEAFVLLTLRKKRSSDSDYFVYDKLPSPAKDLDDPLREANSGEKSTQTLVHAKTPTLSLEFPKITDPEMGKTINANLKKLHMSVTEDLIYSASDGKRWKLISAGSLENTSEEPGALFEAFQALSVPCRIYFELHFDPKNGADGAEHSTLASMNIREFVLSSVARKSQVGHKLLIAAAIIYWGVNIAIYSFSDIQCGKSAPTWAWLLFCASCVTATLVELWVLIHCKFGYGMFSDCDARLIWGIFLGVLGRFDSFSDVSNAVAIQACVEQDPSNFTWFSIEDHVYHLPTNLGIMVKFGLAMIVVLQMIPGLALLVSRSLITTALKLNEFCLVLSAMEQELKKTTF